MRPLDFNEYQDRAAQTAIYPGQGNATCVAQHRSVGENPADWLGVTYCALGLVGEAGEVAEKVKKAIRDGVEFDEFRASVAKELGDVLWYAGQLARELGFQFADIAGGNLDKLEDRQQRSALQGSGDDR